MLRAFYKNLFWQRPLRVIILIAISCLQFFTVSAEDSWNRVYLATYPRSGNHWVRYLIEEAVHIATSSVYCDPREKNEKRNHLKDPFPWGGYAPDHGYEGDCEYPLPGDLVVIKTHYPAKEASAYDLQPSSKIIRIVRHPVDSFKSHFFHNPSNKPRPLFDKVTSLFVKKSIIRWKNFMEYWDAQPNVFTVRYEDLLENPHEMLKNILEEIGYQVSEADVARAVAKHPPQGGVLKHLSFYESADLKRIEKRLDRLMRKYDYFIP